MLPKSGLCGAILGILLAATEAAAAPACPEGTVDGKCVSPQLAQMARQDAVIRTQIHLSISSRNYAPSLDWEFSYPNTAMGAQSYGSQRRATGAAGATTFASPAYVLYGIHN
jgi:hypothetical protein